MLPTLESCFGRDSEVEKEPTIPKGLTESLSISDLIFLKEEEEEEDRTYKFIKKPLRTLRRNMLTEALQ